MTKTNEWAIVTGASKGLGFEYCKELLKMGYNIVGVARNPERLDDLKSINDNLQIWKVPLDLSENDSPEKLFNLTKDLNVTILINNAGYGVLGKFEDSELDKDLNMLNLNIICLHKLSKLFVQKFKQKNKGKIINIGSMAGLMPTPGFSTSYYASKAYVYNLGVSINTELKRSKSKVRLVTVCPGTLKTDFWDRLNEGTKKASISQWYCINTNKFARKTLKKSLKTNKNFITIGFLNKLILFMAWILPQRFFLGRIYKFQSKRVK